MRRQRARVVARPLARIPERTAVRGTLRSVWPGETAGYPVA
jgi:hypothetical protein